MRMSVVHRLTLVAVWLTMVLAGVVFSEPAPFDLLMVGLIALLPIVGLAVLTRPLMLHLSVWLIIGAAGLAAAFGSHDLAASRAHTLITLYLSVAAITIMGFVLRRPEAHARLILGALMVSALVAALAGLAGYFGLGPDDLFMVHGRIRGTFKDPNVLGAFAVPGLLYALYLWMTWRGLRALLAFTLVLTLSLTIVLTVSRGAVANLGVGVLVFGYLSFVTAASNRRRLKLFLLGALGVCLLVVGAGVALQFEGFHDLIISRFTQPQSYDAGPDGRFGGQLKALALILENPAGIGALQFGQRFHPEDVHNVYLSMFLNAGWVGGFGYLAIVAITVIYGFVHALKRADHQGVYLVAYAAFVGLALEGAIIDTDHWRHFFILLALVWGLILAKRQGTHKVPAAIIPPSLLAKRIANAQVPAVKRASYLVGRQLINARAARKSYLLADPAPRRLTRKPHLLAHARADGQSRRSHLLEARTNKKRRSSFLAAPLRT